MFQKSLSSIFIRHQRVVQYLDKTRRQKPGALFHLVKYVDKYLIILLDKMYSYIYT